MRSASRLFVTAVIASSLTVVAPVAAYAIAEDAAQPDAWADEFCAGGTDWIDALRTENDAIAIDLGSPPDSTKVSDALVAFFKAAARSTAQFASRLHDAGVPDVPHGEKIAKALTKALTKVRRAFAHAKGDAAELATSDGDELQAGLDGAQSALRDGLAKVAATVGDVLSRNGSRKLGKALRGEEACQVFLPPVA